MRTIKVKKCRTCNQDFTGKNNTFCSRKCSAEYHSYIMRNNTKLLIKPVSELILSDWQRGWLSGLIDGEGCLSLLSSINNNSTSSSLRYRTTVEIANTNLDILNHIKTICGNVGSITKRKRYEYSGNRKDSYTYKIPTLMQKQILPQLTLIIKQSQSEIFQRVWYLLSLTPGGKGGKRVDQINSELFELKQEIHKLNKRGIY